VVKGTMEVRVLLVDYQEVEILAAVEVVKEM